MINALIVEDNIDHLRLLKRAVERGYGQKISIIHLLTFNDFKNYIEKNQIDLLITDLGLPDSPIEHTLSFLKNHKAKYPIIVLTALDDEKHAKELVACGIQDYICKEKLDQYDMKNCINFAIERKNFSNKLTIFQKDLDNFLETFHHDLMGPLSNIMHSSQFLKEEIDINNPIENQKLIKIIETSASKLHMITHLLIDLININHTKSNKILNFPAIWKQVKSEIGPILRPKKIKYTIEYDEKHIVYDQNHLKAILKNALLFISSNTVKDHEIYIKLQKEQNRRPSLTITSDLTMNDKIFKTKDNFLKNNTYWIILKRLSELNSIKIEQKTQNEKLTYKYELIN